MEYTSLGIDELREDYAKASLLESEINPDPFQQFAKWFEEALASQLREPNAMHLATVGPGGLPAGRVVLLKGFDSQGFTFFTNYQSRKGHNLELHPHCALTFLWAELERQVRIEGIARVLDSEVSTKYFQSRPRKSQIGAWASPQSEVVPNREVLEARFKTFEDKFEGREILERPPHWGGYLVVPRLIEFWQGRRSRMHDRLVYELTDTGTWQIVRLAP